MPALYYYYPSQHRFFSLKLKPAQSHTLIIMYLYSDVINTKDIPTTLEFLTSHFPSVLQTECFNDENLPFCQEVLQTEIGHLFEHILLDYLCMLKIRKGYQEASFSGRTSWNWNIDPKGTFHIRINAGFKDMELIHQALELASTLTSQLFLLPKEHVSQTHTPHYAFLSPSN